MPVQVVKLLGSAVNVNTNVNPTGAYNAGTTYNTGDTVSYNGSSYIALQDTTGNLPTNTTYWQLLAEKGETGDTGATGATGPQGDPGVDGDDGVVQAVVAGTGISVDATDPANPVVTNTQTSAEWGNITGTLSSQTDLQAALDAAKVAPTVVAPSGGDYATVGAAIAGGATNIFVTNGDYTETAEIDITVGDVSIVGESREGVQITFTGGTNGFDITGGENHSLRNLTLIGHSSMTAMIKSTRQYLAIDNIRIETLTNTSANGIKVTGFYASVTKSQFYNIGNAAIEGASTGILIAENDFRQGGNDKAAIKNPGNRARISDNFCYNYKNGLVGAFLWVDAANSGVGITMSGNLIDTTDLGVYVDGPSGNITYSTITGNMFNACGSDGRNIWCESNAIFSNNVIVGNNHDDNLHGYYLEAGDNNMIVGNHFRGRLYIGTSGGRGVYLAGDNNIVNNNWIGEYTQGIDIISGATGNKVYDIEYGTNTDDYADAGTSTEIRDYASISATDSNTDVTGSELEELTDGSETTLHSHAGGGGGQNLYDYIIAPSGGDYTTLGAYFADTPANGDSIYIAPGTYTESASITSSLTEITIHGAGRENTVLDFGANAVTLSGANLEISNLSITTSSSGKTFSGESYKMLNVRFYTSSSGDIAFGGTYGKIIGCHLESDNTAGVFDLTGNNVVMSSCSVDLAGGAALPTFYFRSTNGLMTGCHFTIAGSGTNYAVRFYADNINISNNIFDSGANVFPLYVDQVNRGLFQGNHIDGGQYWSMEIESSNDVTLSGNKFTNVATGVLLDDTNNRIRFIGNSFHRSTTGGDGIRMDATSDDCTLMNNVFYNFSNGVNIGAATCDNNVVAYNHFHNCTTDISDSGTSTTSTPNIST